MKANKNKLLYFVVIALLLGLFNLITFLIPFSRGGNFWVGYVSITLSALFSAGILYFIFDKKDIKSRFYGVPLIYVLRSYIVLQFIIGIIQMAVPAFNYKYAIIVNAIIIVFSIIGLIGLTAGKEEIERIDKKVKQKILYIREIQVSLEGVIDNTKNIEVLKELNKLKNLVRYSDPMSNEKVESLEINILENINLLDSLKDEEKLKEIKEIEKQIKERNRLVKIYK